MSRYKRPKSPTQTNLALGRSTAIPKPFSRFVFPPRREPWGRRRFWRERHDRR
jgi:hypothetical protein